MIKTLLSVRLRSALSGLSATKKKDGSSRVGKGRIIALSLAYLYVIVVLGGMFTLQALSMAPVLIAAGLDWFYFAAFTTIAFAMVFLLSIFETKSELFECKDNELLLSMPIKPSDIVISRIFTVLIYNYLETLLVMLPAIICYAISGGSIVGIIGSAVVTLLLPLLATSLSAGVGYAVALIAKKIKRNSFLTVGISVVFLLLYFWGYSALMGSVGEDESFDFVALGNSLSGMRFIGEASMLHPLFTSLFALISIGAAALTFFLISKSYFSIVTASSVSKKAKYKFKNYKGTSAYFALTKKEFSMFVSSPTYMLNSAIGIVFTVLLSGALLLNKGQISLLLAELSKELVGVDLSGAAAAVLCGVLLMMQSFNLISSSSLSLEGKSLWLLRSLPVSAEKYLLAKATPAFIIPLVPNLVASVFIAIAVEADPISVLFLVLVPLAANLFTALLGIFINALFPKFRYENEAQVVKQSLATFISMLAATLYGLINIAIAVIFSLLLGSSLLAMVMMLVLSLALSGALLAMILGPMSRKYNNYSV